MSLNLSKHGQNHKMRENQIELAEELDKLNISGDERLVYDLNKNDDEQNFNIEENDETSELEPKSRDYRDNLDKRSNCTKNSVLAVEGDNEDIDEKFEDNVKMLYDKEIMKKENFDNKGKSLKPIIKNPTVASINIAKNSNKVKLLRNSMINDDDFNDDNDSVNLSNKIPSEKNN